MMHFSIGRSDDIRLFHLCHLVAPILIKCIGPVPFFVMAAMLTGGKTQQVFPRWCAGSVNVGMPIAAGAAAAAAAAAAVVSTSVRLLLPCSGVLKQQLSMPRRCVVCSLVSGDTRACHATWRSSSAPSSFWPTTSSCASPSTLSHSPTPPM